MERLYVLAVRIYQCLVIRHAIQMGTLYYEVKHKEKSVLSTVFAAYWPQNSEKADAFINHL